MAKRIQQKLDDTKIQKETNKILKGLDKFDKEIFKEYLNKE